MLFHAPVQAMASSRLAREVIGREVIGSGVVVGIAIRRSTSLNRSLQHILIGVRVRAPLNGVSNMPTMGLTNVELG